MSGGPSHWKRSTPSPTCNGCTARSCPTSFGPVKTRRGVDKNKLLATKRTFKKYGRCGIEVSDLLPNLGASARTTCACCAAATATA